MNKLFLYRLTHCFAFISAFLILACNPSEDPPDYKPNIYIYPTKPICMDVKVSFPKGGRITTSIPEYRSGWNVSVDTQGVIDKKYTYLFYESVQPDVWQKQSGWVVKKGNLKSFFLRNMKEYGFSDAEIKDFIDYWIPRFKDYPFFAIYPQTNDRVDKVIHLDFSLSPDRILRLHYLIKAEMSGERKLQTPHIVPFVRQGFFVAEWGVIL